ncbi:MAG: C39 family peptidase [Anaerolineales bacterium]
MKRTQTVILLAAASVLILLAQPASAQCNPGDPDCALDPPISREITNHEGSAPQLPGSGESLHSLQPLDVPAPPFVLADPETVLQPEALGADFETLAVSLRRQEPGDLSCGVQALGMALDGLDGAGPTSATLLAFLQAQGYLYEFGTGVEELAAAAVHFGYAGAYSFHGWSLDQLRQELAAGRPVVLDLGANGPGQPGHFITLTGISPDSHWLAFHDPLLGERILPLSEFQALWNAQGASGVAVGTNAPTAGDPGFESWMTAVLAMMATLSLAPGMLGRKDRPGVGGALMDESASGATVSTVALEPPYSAPAGTHWERGDPVYETHTKTVLEYEEIPNLVYKQVQVGVEYEQIPYTKTIEVDEGQWVTDYRTERYVSGYRTKKILLYYKTQRYVAYYRTQRYPLPWGGYGYRQVPVYGYRQVPVYGYEQVPVYSTRQVEDGQHWESNWVTHEYTEYKTVEKPVYEWQWVQEGVQRVPVERQVEEQVLVGYRWTLVEDMAEEPLPVERANMDYDLHTVQDQLAHTPKAQLLQELLTGQDSAFVQAFVVTNPLNIRQDPDADSPRLAVASPGEIVLWTGGGSGASAEDGSWRWIQVVYYDRWKGEIRGWVKSDYLASIPEVPAGEPAGSLDLEALLREALLKEWSQLSPTLRAEMLRQEKLEIDQMQAVLHAFFDSRVPTHDVVYETMLEEELERLLELPAWYVNDSAPGIFMGEYQLDLGAIEVLLAMASLMSGVESSAQDTVWETMAAGLDVAAADVVLAATGQLAWSEHAPATAGDFPVTLWVSDPAGAMLRVEPRWDSEPVLAPFSGIPYGSQEGSYETCVTWDGRYHLGTDKNGDPCTYYYITYYWKPNGRTYSGWVVAEYFTPQLAPTGLSPAILRDYGINTLGYGDGLEPWEAYWAGGAVQNLNLSLLFQLMGDPDYAQYAVKHSNLCGILAVMEALGVSLEEGFARWKDLGDGFVDVLMNGGKGTEDWQLERYINAFSDYGWGAQVASLSIRALPDLLDRNEQVIALVTIDTTLGANGTVSDEGQVSHWVHIISMNDEIVRYYNPYTNCEQTVGVNDFEQAWETTPGNTGRFTAVVGSK